MLEFEEVKVDIDNGDVDIKGPMFNKIVDINTIKKISLDNVDDYGFRMMGFGAIRVHTGDYQNKTYGSYKLATYTENKVNIVIVTNDNITYVFNQQTKDATQKLFNQINALI